MVVEMSAGHPELTVNNHSYRNVGQELSNDTDYEIAGNSQNGSGNEARNQYHFCYLKEMKSQEYYSDHKLNLF